MSSTDPPSYFEAYFFNKYLPQLGLYSRPIEERYRVVKKKNKGGKPEFVFPPDANKTWNEMTIPPAYDDVSQSLQPLRHFLDTTRQRQIVFEAMVGRCSFQIVEDILIGTVHRLEFELYNDLNVMVRLRVHIGSTHTNRLIYEATVEDKSSGVVVGPEKNSGQNKITMELFRNKEEKIIFRKLGQQMGKK